MAAAAAYSDVRFMRRALDLARRAEGNTAPNPMVGAIVVRSRRVVGQGYHRAAGLPHAEVEAIRQAGRRARGATLYVTLEPCNHTGRTPPCCNAILAAGIRRVVVAARDPNPHVAGRGIERLRKARVRVTRGVLEAPARRLNEGFWSAMTRGRPFIIAKVGQSLDGKLATSRGQSKWITSARSRSAAQQWRRRADAILVGVDTVLADDPRLTRRGRFARTKPLLRVVVDSGLRVPAAARCLRTSAGRAIVACTGRASASRARRLARGGVEVWRFPARGRRVPLGALVRRLATAGVNTLLIEGGGEVLGSAFAERLVDYVVWFVAPRILGGRAATPAVGGPGFPQLTRAPRVEHVTVTRVGPDLCIEGRVVYPGG